MTQIAGLPSFITILAITVECGATLLLLLGFGTRMATTGIFILFIGMIVFIHSPNGFFMNWFGKLSAGKEGFEYHLTYLEYV